MKREHDSVIQEGFKKGYSAELYPSTDMKGELLL